MENPGFWGSNAPKPAVSAEKAGAWGTQRVRSFGEPGTARESGFAEATRQVTLRSLTTFFDRFARGERWGFAPNPTRGRESGKLA